MFSLFGTPKSTAKPIIELKKVNSILSENIESGTQYYYAKHEGPTTERNATEKAEDLTKMAEPLTYSDKPTTITVKSVKNELLSDGDGDISKTEVNKIVAILPFDKKFVKTFNHIAMDNFNISINAIDEMANQIINAPSSITKSTTNWQQQMDTGYGYVDTLIGSSTSDNIKKIGDSGANIDSEIPKIVLDISTNINKIQNEYKTYNDTNKEQRYNFEKFGTFYVVIKSYAVEIVKNINNIKKIIENKKLEDKNDLVPSSNYMFSEEYDFYTDKPTKGGKRSKSRRQKRSAKKSRKHRKTSKK